MAFADMSFKHKGYAWLGGVCLSYVIIFIVYYFFILVPQLDSQNQTANRFQQEKHKVEVVENFMLAHPDLPKYLQDLDREIARTSRLLPDKQNMGDTLALLEETAKNSNVVLGPLSTDKSVFHGGEGWTETQVSFQVGGSYTDLMNFCQKLDRAPRVLVIRNFEFFNRVTLDQRIYGRADVQAFLEKVFSNRTGMLGSTVTERGLLTKPTLVVIKLYVIVPTMGQLPDTEGDGAQSKP